MTHRFFRATPDVYENVRAQIDAAWGYPTPAGTQTCIPPASDQVKDASGKCVIGVAVDWCGWEPVATLLPQLLAVGAVEEMTADEYWAIVSPAVPE